MCIRDRLYSLLVCWSRKTAEEFLRNQPQNENSVHREASQQAHAVIEPIQPTLETSSSERITFSRNFQAIILLNMQRQSYDLQLFMANQLRQMTQKYLHKSDKVFNSIFSNFANEEQFLEKICGDVCCICINEMKFEDSGFIKNCKHTFHAECLKEWLNHEMFCPLCKSQIGLIS
eukprot:TRINITY_DN5773_c0_g1_i3.p1 TRINITY_DN5773_c0_g1~~TRINITY_DN5773_c0_g1_i3.p1  ORF type:complete len:175 (-),score=5.09 TRINITY_DN5773_c0_g1_i3:52-576(-)